MAKKSPAPQPKPRGIRFPDRLYERLRALAASTHRTFSDMVIHACTKGLDVLDQEEVDRRQGERLRKAKERR